MVYNTFVNYLSPAIFLITNKHAIEWDTKNLRSNQKINKGH